MKNHEFKFIDLRIDWAFKYVYGSPGNEDLLLSLIDAILPEKHIRKVELRQQEQIPDNHKQRRREEIQVRPRVCDRHNGLHNARCGAQRPGDKPLQHPQ